MNAILFCSVGRRVRLLKDLRKSQKDLSIVAIDKNPFAPALFAADRHFIPPAITDGQYIEYLLDLCQSEGISAITTLIDPEIEILGKNRHRFIENGVLPLVPTEETASICYDKYRMFEYLQAHQIPTILTYRTYENFVEGLNNGEISFPVFIKPRKGSGSIGAAKINDLNELKQRLENAQTDYIIQPLMTGLDLDVDVYVDCISGKPVSIFSKRKIESRAGGAIKTVSFNDINLVNFVKKVISKFEFYGPIDIDLFYVNGQYYLSEINPRFGGGYPHAFGAGVDFFRLIVNNLNGIENIEQIGNYEDDVMMLMYEDFIIEKKSDLIQSASKVQPLTIEMNLI
ncbi:ATP-grasp domain-containing protein [Emticicia sp. 21SJ11W-3]|uniref:ATP-grasp domain-containing protein n=1 Tax=Emticicia sp. 21SJ11W-3 TaxID=2916755 RepID=UPI0020A0DB72|nr:ATP-grasp domain-containing protein [Emticicia sp. 21SJ11W-3]UTA69816.1 ATP-grasp domain-containing protein [Emticicia sp. 21SJ11W-3]